MTLPTRNTLSKSERLHGRNAVEQLFQKAKRSSMVVFPLRAVYTLTTEEEQQGEAAVRVLVSVSKKHFKRAVKRNRAKRQVREAYRTLGGTPHLDGIYTVFGEVVSGLEVVDSIQNVATDENDRPIEDVVVTSIKINK